MRKEIVLVMCLMLPAIVFLGRATAGEGKFTVTILYDNTAFARGTEADWGFSCFVEGSGKTILFDTGTKPEVFFHNVEALGVDLSQVELAARIGLSVSAAKSRVQRARQMVREIIDRCCRFEVDRYGRVIACHPRHCGCAVAPK